MTYRYKCPRCGIELDMEQSITDEYRPNCGLCDEDDHSVKMQRVIQLTGFVLKGSGWGKDGYSKKR